MQSAMVANLRERIPGVEFVGITLNPGETRRRLGIAAFPLAGASQPNYALFNLPGSNTSRQQTKRLERIKQSLKKIPALRTVWRAAWGFGAELTHIAAAARLVRNLDCLIIPGGGALDDFWGGPWGHPWNLFKWSALSRVHRVPFLFVSIGKCSLERPLSRFFVRIALRFAAYRSYRDNDSKAAVQSLAGAHDDPVCPDLAFSYPLAGVPALPRSRLPQRWIVGVSPMAYCDPRAWPRKDGKLYAQYVNRLAEMVKWLVKEECRVLLFTTDSPDAAAVEDVKRIVAGSIFDSEKIQALPGSAELSPDGLLQGISPADLVIASRLHGVILAHLNAIPALALSFDPKVDAHMKAVGQQDYCLSIDQVSFEMFTERFNALKVHRDREAANIRSAALAFRDQLDGQYNRLFGAPTSGSVTSRQYNPIESASVAQAGDLRTE